MFFPVRAPPLRFYERGLRIFRFRRAPLDAEVFPERDDDHAVPDLRHSIIRGVDGQGVCHITLGRVAAIPLLNSLQTLVMLIPKLFIMALIKRVFQLPQYVAEVGCERRPEQAAHVLAKNRSRTCFPDDPEQFREHVALVFVALVDSAKAEGLARRSPGYDVHPAFQAGEVHLADIAFYQRPRIGESRGEVRSLFVVDRRVLPERLACVVRELVAQQVPETNSVHRQSQAAATSVQLHAGPHRYPGGGLRLACGHAGASHVTHRTVRG